MAVEIIDVVRDGRALRVLLGEKTKKWGYTNPNYKDYTGKTPEWLKPSKTFYGDDWNDFPYEHNAGPVYEEFVKAYMDMVVDFNYSIVLPGDGYHFPYLGFSKDDFVHNKQLPYLIVTKHDSDEITVIDHFEGRGYKELSETNDPDVIKIYIGGSPDVFKNKNAFHILDVKDYYLSPKTTFTS